MHAVSRFRVRALARTLILVVMVAALAAVTTGSASAIGPAGSNFPPPNGLNGWYIATSVPGQMIYDVDGFAQPPINSGDYDEQMSNAICTASPGGTVVGSHGPASSNAHVPVTVSGDTSPAGTVVTCLADYDRRFYSCVLFVCFPTGPFLPFASNVVNQHTLKIDSSPPVSVTALHAPPNGANGWYRSPVGVSFNGFDPNSGLNFACRSGAPFGPGGIGQSIGPADTPFEQIFGGCQNGAGLNTSVVVTYKYDGTDPTLAPTVSPNSVVLNGSATASPGADDNLSGIDTASCDPVDTSTLGSHTVSCTATDKAGNTATAQASYDVVSPLVFTGFFQPVDMTGINGANSGQTIPLKFRVTNGNGVPVTDLASVEVTATSLACDLGVTPDQLEEYASGNSGLQNQGNGNYQFNWKTPKTYAKSCKTLKLDLGDGIDHTAEFRFTK